MGPTQEVTAFEIFDSLDRELRHHILSAEQIVSKMLGEMMLAGIRQQEAIAFLIDRLRDMERINMVTSRTRSNVQVIANIVPKERSHARSTSSKDNASA